MWQKAMKLAVVIYRLSPKLPREELYGMRSQLTRSAASVPANIAEGWTRTSKADTAQFLAVAHGSLAEAETFVRLCASIGWFSDDDVRPALELADEVSRMLTTLRRSTRTK